MTDFASLSYGDETKAEHLIDIFNEANNYFMDATPVTDAGAGAVAMALAVVDEIDQLDRLRDPLTERAIRIAPRAPLAAAGRLLVHAPVDWAILGRGHVADELRVAV